MKNWNNPEIIDECLNHIKVDLMPFHDVFRSIYGYNKVKPNHFELMNTLELITFLVDEKDVIPIFGPDMKPSGNSSKLDIQKIKAIATGVNYENYSYTIWFDKNENWKDK